MSNIRKILVLALVAVVFSMGAVGCKSGDKARNDEHPKGDHPKH